MEEAQGQTERVMLITGASTGIGAATARQAVRRGFKVVLTARHAGKLAELVTELGDERALAQPCDVTSLPQLQQVVAETLTRFSRLDVVFANAGLSKGGVFLGGEDTEEAWREMILTNVLGVALTARATLPELLRTRGHLLITGSVAGHVAPPQGLYPSTKWALVGMSESLRKTVTPHGVRVTLVSPGRVDTPFWDGRASANFPTLTADDVAHAVLFAVSQPPHVDISELLVRPVGQDL